MDNKQDYFDIVFVVLNYINTEDLTDFIKSVNSKIKKLRYKIVIVNSFYNKETKEKTEKIAKANNCDFLNVENKGYSFGNNEGIEYTMNNYNFKYLIVANPDTIIKEFPENIDYNDNADIIAPKIIAKDGRMQNPMVVKENQLSEILIYWGFKHNIKLLLYVGIILNKINRKYYMIKERAKETYQIFAAHGSFVIFKKNALNILGNRPYDENMFLFAEEMVIGIKAKANNLKTFYNSSIIINHKEDGSMNASKISVKGEMARANIYYYENYRKKELV